VSGLYAHLARDDQLVREKIAVIGSRHGADLKSVVTFLDALWANQPDTLLISGGAEGVDSLAESTWFRLGGRIRSYRPVSDGEGWIIEIWNYGPGESSVSKDKGIQLASFRDAALYRDTLIAEDCHRLCAFYRPNGSAGTAFTESWARDKGKDVHTFVARASA